jgi:hypothetical protein
MCVTLFGSPRESVSLQESHSSGCVKLTLTPEHEFPVDIVSRKVNSYRPVPTHLLSSSLKEK